MKFISILFNCSAKNGLIVEVSFYAVPGAISFFVSICPCAELSGAVTDPCVYVSINRGWGAGGIIRIRWPMGEKPSIHTWTPAGNHLWCQTRGKGDEGLEQSAFSQTSPRDMRRGSDWAGATLLSPPTETLAPSKGEKVLNIAANYSSQRRPDREQGKLWRS